MSLNCPGDGDREGEREKERGRLGSRAIHRWCVGLGLELHAKSVDKAFSQLELNERELEPGEPPPENWNSVQSRGIEQGLISSRVQR